MTKILVMTYGHEWWNKAADFAEHCSWRAGKTLADMMRRNTFAENERVIAALCNGEIAGFCTFSNRDELPEKYPFSPFAGFVFVDERFRGQ
ncbi:MAG: GNAT family N-acetyltransferase, partial [Clostridiales bacterium]|nr:GNAT family N-acetyltransferase [Clostridiales bacterium]